MESLVGADGDHFVVGRGGGEWGKWFPEGKWDALERLCYQPSPSVYAVDFGKCCDEIARRLAESGRAYRMDLLVRRVGKGRFIDVGKDDSVLQSMVTDEMRLVYDVLSRLGKDIDGCAVIEIVETKDDGSEKVKQVGNPAWTKTIGPWVTRGGGFIRDLVSGVVSSMGALAARENWSLFGDFGMPNYGVPTVAFADGVWSICYGFGESPIPDDAVWYAPHKGTGALQFFRPFREEDRFLRWSPMHFLSGSDMADLQSLRVKIGAAAAASLAGAGAVAGLAGWGKKCDVCLVGVGGASVGGGMVSDLLEELVGEQLGSLMDALSECFMSRPKEVAVLLFGGQGSGKSTIADLMRTLLGVRDESMGNDHPDPEMIMDGRDSHPEINRMYLHRSALFLGDYGHGGKLGSCLTREVSTKATKGYRALYGNRISGGIPVWCTEVLEGNNTMGLLGDPSADASADDRRVFGVQVTAFARSDPRRGAKYASLRAVVEGGDGSGEEDRTADDLRVFARDLLNRVQFETWKPTDRERAPYINACEEEREGSRTVVSAVEIASFSGLVRTGKAEDVVVLRELYRHMSDDGWKGKPAQYLKVALEEKGYWFTDYQVVACTTEYRRDVTARSTVGVLVGWRSERYSGVGGEGRVVLVSPE